MKSTAARALPKADTTLPVVGLLVAPAVVVLVIVLLIRPFIGAGST